MGGSRTDHPLIRKLTVTDLRGQEELTSVSPRLRFSPRPTGEIPPLVPTVTASIFTVDRLLRSIAEVDQEAAETRLVDGESAPIRLWEAMQDIHKRLRQLREHRGLSLREMASRVTLDGGHRVSHDSVRKYEEGRSIPSDYMIAVCSAFHVSPDWLLFGRGSMRARTSLDASAALEAVGDIVRAFRGEKEEWQLNGWTRAARRLWEQFAETLTPADPIQFVSVGSWHPPSDGGGSTALLTFRRVDDAELRERKAVLSALVRAAEEHLGWMGLLFQDVDHVAILTDRDGIVLSSVGSSDEIVAEWRMEAGSDWSEAAMGQTAVATVLASGYFSAVLGTDVDSFHDFGCVAAPLSLASDSGIAVLGLAVRLPNASPPRLATTAYVARMIERAAARE